MSIFGLLVQRASTIQSIYMRLFSTKHVSSSSHQQLFVLAIIQLKNCSFDVKQLSITHSLPVLYYTFHGNPFIQDINIKIKRHNNRNICCITSSIPTAPAYGGYISHMMRYSKSCGYYRDFLERELLQTKGSNQFKLKSSLRKFYGRHHDFAIITEYPCHK